MLTLVILYPAYGTVSCARLGRYAAQIDGLRLVLADEAVNITNEDIFEEVIELPPPEELPAAYEIMRRWCAKRHADGIFVQSERGLLLGSLLAEELGLKGPGVRAAHLCSNKYLQRVVLSQAGIPNPRFALAEDATGVRRLANDYGFPLILKCVISTMSRLVTPVFSAAEIDGAVARVKAGLLLSEHVTRLEGFSKVSQTDLACDPGRQFLVESFLSGDAVETDGLVIDGGPFTFGVTEQIQSVDPPFFIEGYLLPAECVNESQVEAVSDAVIRAINLQNTGFSIEMRVLGNEVHLMEVNGRLGWDEGLGEMFASRTHEERIVQAAQIALGIIPARTCDRHRFAALAYRTCYYDGIVEDLPAREEMNRRENENLRIQLGTHLGARFYAPPSPEAYPHSAWALATHPVSSHAAYNLARTAINSLDIKIRRLG